MSIRVIDAGLFTLPVDYGRTGSRSLGVPLGGAADRAAMAIGNALVGNPPDAVALELTLAGPTLVASHRVACVVFGAAFGPRVNDRTISAGTTFTLEPGDILRTGSTHSGCRGYFCVAGGFALPLILGSRSALQPLRAGDELHCPPSRIEGRSLSPQATEELFPPTRLLRVLDGPQRDWFTDALFFSQGYEVGAASNRMGLRMNGKPLQRRPGELVSEAVAPGAVQVTNDGLPVILGVDGQTIGGYPKIVHVIRADLDLLGRLRPGDGVRFARVNTDEANAAARARAAMLKQWITRLHIAERQPELGALLDLGEASQ